MGFHKHLASYVVNPSRHALWPAVAVMVCLGGAAHAGGDGTASHGVPAPGADLDIALEVDRGTLRAMLDKGHALGVDTHGIVDHDLFESLYFRDPNGYVDELCSRLPGHGEGMDPRHIQSRDRLDCWLELRRAGV